MIELAQNAESHELSDALEKLGQEAARLQTVIDTVPSFLWTSLPDGSKEYLNKRWYEYTGLPLEQAKGWGWKVVVHPDDLDRLIREWLAMVDARKPGELETRIRRYDGEYRWFLIRVVPELDAEGNLVRWFGSNTDIEDRKRAEAKLVEQGRLVRWYATGTDIHDRKRCEDRTRNENVALREDIVRSSMFEEIVGSSEALRQVLVQVSKVAPTDSTVLVLGETGTGKELIARAIHNRSKRSNRAFIRVNCAAIPASLIASELFGHEKGSFTGATQRRLGRFESADSGTIFLDEVGDLPPETQVALLRVLQEREFERVGGGAFILCGGESFFVDEAWLTRVPPKSAMTSVPLVANLAENEKEMLEAALRESEGVVGGQPGAAVKLGIPRQTLESKIRKLGINRYRFKAS